MKLCDFLKNDMDDILEMDMDWSVLHNKSILVTGATGLIGSMICKTLGYISSKQKWNLKVIALARNEEKLKEIFSETVGNENIVFLNQTITEPIKVEEHVDYIIHTACPTASNVFITKPVETIQAIVAGTANILDFAKKAGCSSVLYLSSMEAYGQIMHEDLLTPEDAGYINPLSLRSCYPQGKRMAENLCISYFSEYQVPVKIIRLAQTFGPGIPESDNRVFAQFIRSVLQGKDIVMFTEGGSKRMYIDTMDAVSACLMVLLNGEAGQAYNAANETTYCAIKEMAQLVIKEFGTGKSKLVIDKSKDVGQYPPDNMLFLDVSPLQKLGWSARYNLKDMYTRMIQEM